MKLSKDEQLFLESLLIDEDNLKDCIDATLEPSNQLLCQLSSQAQLLLVAKMHNREVYFPLIDANDIDKLASLHYAFPHVVDVRGVYRHWRITPDLDTYLESSCGRWPIHSLSLSGALLGHKSNSTRHLDALTEEVLLIKTAQGEHIPVVVQTLKQRDQTTLVVAFDELTVQSPALKEFLLKSIFQHGSQ